MTTCDIGYPKTAYSKAAAAPSHPNQSPAINAAVRFGIVKGAAFSLVFAALRDVSQGHSLFVQHQSGLAVPQSHMNHTSPVIILGAARSGTRLLRSLIASAGSHAEVPFDVNYIWRFGNESCPHDCLQPAKINEQHVRFIRSQLKTCCQDSTTRPIVEKTVGNVLRIPFVHQVYPDAKYIFLYRNGRDVIESAHRCWQDPPSAGYLFDKIKTFPWWKCRSYAARYLKQIASRSLGMSANLNSWGPRYRRIDFDVANRSLLEVCCRQWVACMDAYERDRQALPANIRIEVRYEDLIHNGTDVSERIANFLNLQSAQPLIQFCQDKVHRSSEGKYARLDESEQGMIELIAGRTMERWGYRDQHNVAA